MMHVLVKLWLVACCQDNLTYLLSGMKTKTVVFIHYFRTLQIHTVFYWSFRMFFFADIYSCMLMVVAVLTEKTRAEFVRFTIKIKSLPGGLSAVLQYACQY